MYVHLTARAQRLPVALTEHDVACWLWPRLQRAFPSAAAAVLMPNHPHLVTDVQDPEQAHRGLCHVLAGLRRSDCPGREVRWEPVGLPGIVPDLKHLRRLVRYLALNPCRAGLCDDPLRWPWSTHRDVVGAIGDPWIDADRLAAALGLPARRFAEAHHRYVSASGSVSTASTRFPCRAEPVDVAVRPLAALAAAAAAATRAAPADIRREGRTRALFLQLAARHGWRSTQRLAAMCEMDPSSVRWNLRQELDAAAVRAAELCLGDQRLLTWQAPQHRAFYSRKAGIEEAMTSLSASQFPLSGN